MLFAPSIRTRCARSAPIALTAALLLVAVMVGCNRGQYRRAADREVQCLIESGSTDPRWPLEDYTINPDPRSRFYDPNEPDCPPDAGRRSHIAPPHALRRWQKGMARLA